MSSRCFKLIVGLILLYPVSGWTHALSPTYYPVGPFPIFAGIESWIHFCQIPVSVAVSTLILNLWMPAIGLHGNFWRAGILYIVSRVGEASAVYLLHSIPLFRRAGWSSLMTENLFPLLVFLASGLAFALPAALMVYRESGQEKGRIISAVFVASLAAYLAAAGLSFAIMRIRGY